MSQNNSLLVTPAGIGTYHIFKIFYPRQFNVGEMIRVVYMTHDITIFETELDGSFVFEWMHE